MLHQLKLLFAIFFLSIFVSAATAFGFNNFCHERKQQNREDSLMFVSPVIALVCSVSCADVLFNQFVLEKL